MRSTFARNTPPDRPQAHRRGVARRPMLVFAGVLLATALLVVFFNIDWGGGARPQPARSSDFDRQIGEFAINNGPVAFDGPRDDSPAGSHRDMDVELPSGARFIKTDADGRIARELIAERLEPQGQGVFKLLKPRMTAYLSNGRRLTIEGDDGLGRRNEADEFVAGTVEGRVIVRMFETAADNLRPDEPTLIILSDSVSFDHTSGEIHCPGWVDVQTREAAYSGIDLTALYSEKDGLQRLLVKEPLPPARIVAASVEPIAPRGPGPAHEEAGDAAGQPLPAAGEGHSRRGSIERDAFVAATRPAQGAAADNRSRPGRAGERSGRESGAAGPPGEPRFYNATFYENVRIWRDGAQETITGDELRLTFSMENQGLSRTAETGRPARERAVGTEAGAAILPVRLLPAASAVGFVSGDRFAEFGVAPIVPPPAEGDTYIAHDGQLIVAPVHGSIETCRGTRAMTTPWR